MLPTFEWKTLVPSTDNGVVKDIAKLLEVGWELVGIELPANVLIFKRVSGYR